MSTVVVLGMHRSGTSCVAKALHEGGLYLGPALMAQTATDNLEGHWEAIEAVGINETILSASGAAWDHVPADLSLVAPEGIEDRITAFLGELAAQPMSGFKDPRTLVTFPLWKPHLNGARIVACLRHPYNVARSLARRRTDPWSMERGLALWREYNSRLLKYTEEVADPSSVYWFDYDTEPDAAQAALEGMMARLGLCRPAGGFNPFLRHHEEQTEIEDPQIAELYQTLRQRAAAQGLASSAAAAEAADAALRLRQLRDVHAHHDEILQRQQASMADLERRMSEVLAEARSRCEQLAAQRDELAARCQTLEQTILQHAEVHQALDTRLETRLQETGHSYAEQLYQQHVVHAAGVNYITERLLLAEQGLVCPRLVRKAREAVKRLKSFSLSSFVRVPRDDARQAQIDSY